MWSIPTCTTGLTALAARIPTPALFLRTELRMCAEAGVPWDQTHPSPNDWFAAFNGEVHNL